MQQCVLTDETGFFQMNPNRAGCVTGLQPVQLYLAEPGVRSWLEVAPGVHHPFLLTDRVFGKPEQLLTSAGRIRAVRS